MFYLFDNNLGCSDEDCPGRNDCEESEKNQAEPVHGLEGEKETYGAYHCKKTSNRRKLV